MTFVHMGQSDWSWKIVSSLVESVEVTCRLKGYAGGTFRPPDRVNDFFRQLMDAGVTQHYLVVEGDHREVLRDFAAINEFEAVEI
jgi:hypothetical protein